MNRKNLKSNNRNVSMLATFLTILFGIIIFLIPLLLVSIIPQSAIGNSFISHMHYGYSILPIIKPEDSNLWVACRIVVLIIFGIIISL